MELYYIIAITDHDRGEAMGSLYHAAGLHLILSMPARGTATSEHLAIYGLDATEKCVIAAVGSAQEADSLIRSAKRKLFIDIPGNGVMLTVPLKSVAGGKTLSYLTDDLKAGGAPNMNFEHELITVILNEGYSDFVMDAARAAGAGGGTVLHAKGTGGTRGEKFFSVSLADEKDMIYIIAHKDEKAAIMRSINEQAGPGSKAGAICFSLPISSARSVSASAASFSEAALPRGVDRSQNTSCVSFSAAPSCQMRTMFRTQALTLLPGSSGRNGFISRWSSPSFRPSEVMRSMLSTLGSTEPL